MFKNRSKVLFSSLIVSSLYLVYLLNYFFSGLANSEGAEQVGGAIATALVLPHMVFLLLGIIFVLIGFFARYNWANLTSAILYCVSAVAFPLYAMFLIPSIILGFVGFNKQKKLTEMSRNEENIEVNSCIDNSEKSVNLKNKNYKKIAIGIGGILVVIILISMIFGGNDKQTTSKETSSRDNEITKEDEKEDQKEDQKEEKQITDNKTEEDKTEFVVGEIAELKGTQLQVVDISISNGDDWDSPKSGNEYVIVTVNIKNTTDDTVSYNSYDFTMRNDKGQISDIAFTTVDSDTALNSGELLYNGMVTGTLCFEQPIGSELTLIYTPSFWSDKSIEVDLSKKLKEFQVLEQEEIKISEEIYAMGDIVELNGMEVSVIGGYKSNGDDWDTPRDGYEYVIVQVTMKNNDSEIKSYNPYDFKILDNMGNIVDSGLITIDNDTSLSSGELVQYGEVDGTISFETSRNAEKLYLLYEPDVFSDSKIIFQVYNKEYDEQNTTEQNTVKTNQREVFDYIGLSKQQIEEMLGQYDESDYFQGGEYWKYEEENVVLFFNEVQEVHALYTLEGSKVGNVEIGSKPMEIKSILGEPNNEGIDEEYGNYYMTYVVNGYYVTFEANDYDSPTISAFIEK